MNLETQIRRTVMSFLVLGAFGSVAALGGERLDATKARLQAAEVESCVSADVLQANDEPVALPTVEIAPVSVRLDWRARLPATIARSRS